MNNCKYCKADCALRGEENVKECKGHIPMTNADRIRAMSDKELKEFLCSILKCEFCKFQGWGGCELLHWLQKPAEPMKEE